MLFIRDIAVAREASPMRENHPQVWKTVRRFNLPNQLGVAAALDVARTAASPADADLISIAPCHSGSPELYRWLSRVAVEPAQLDRPLRVNPTHTMHAMDNLALSAVAIALGNRGPGLGLGGSAGQAWEALDIAQTSTAGEVILFACDQDSSIHGGDALGVALLLSTEARADDLAHIATIERTLAPLPTEPAPHSARGLAALATAIEKCAPGELAFEVPGRDGDGIDVIVVHGVVR